MARRSSKPTKAYRTQLVVGLTPALAAHLDDGTTTPDTAHLARLSSRARISLRPQGVRSLDSQIDDDIVWYAATLVSDGPAAADEVAAALRDVHGVAAAYLKPPDGAP